MPTSSPHPSAASATLDAETPAAVADALPFPSWWLMRLAAALLERVAFEHARRDTVTAVALIRARDAVNDLVRRERIDLERDDQLDVVRFHDAHAPTRPNDMPSDLRSD